MSVAFVLSQHLGLRPLLLTLYGIESGRAEVFPGGPAVSYMER